MDKRKITDRLIENSHYLKSSYYSIFFIGLLYIIFMEILGIFLIKFLFFVGATMFLSFGITVFFLVILGVVSLIFLVELFDKIVAVVIIIGMVAGTFSSRMIPYLDMISTETMHNVSISDILKQPQKYKGVGVFYFSDAIPRNDFTEGITVYRKKRYGATYGATYSSSYYVLPIVEETWNPNKTVPAWGVTQSSYRLHNDYLQEWKENKVGIRETTLYLDEYREAIQKALKRYHLKTIPDAPMVELVISAENNIQEKKETALMAGSLGPILWIIGIGIYYYVEKKKRRRKRSFE